MTARIDMEQSALILGHEAARRALVRNRHKGIPNESVAQLIRMSQDEADEVLHALRADRGDDAVMDEIGDAIAYLYIAAWRVRGGQ